ncbi:type II secretion system protein F (GspF) [Salinihabitans flavidus]|uniref:Type II secretion system protein F (GspF) n=1 Tax=Salinihabitans flavidus TaxID=569882 RepID=A0A1H8SM47_9RHOB|nr:type II secretion system F family protein [Salinihabitans flavidus]SEO79752.1 type II secretion system protein F (GspF) [Salinihabitans flavidus]
MLDRIMDILTGTLGPFGPLILVGGLGVALIVLTIVMMVKDHDDPLNKLKNASAEGTNRKDRKEKLRRASSNERLAKYKAFLEPQDHEELSSIKLKLLQAGYHSRDAVRYFHLSQFALGIGGLICGLAYFTLVKGSDGATTKQMLMYVLGPGGAGYLLPKYWVTRRLESRKEEITDGFPDSLDMLLVCVEAGQSLDQSIVRVARELRASFPSLADEFEIVAYEMKAGKDKSQVLSDMGERCGVQDVSSFVTVLIQSSTFGTSIAEALRVYAAEMRDKRVMRAEEKANKLPTKMTLATMMLTVPPLLIILVGPSVHGITMIGK